MEIARHEKMFTRKAAIAYANVENPNMIKKKKYPRAKESGPESHVERLKNINIYFFLTTHLIRSRVVQCSVSSREISRSYRLTSPNALLGHIEFFHFVNVYFCFRHASITDGAFVAESGRSIHGSSASVLGEAAQYRTEGRIRLLQETLLNYIHFRITKQTIAISANTDDIAWYRTVTLSRFLSNCRDIG